jgi:serine/threonine-protein kinase HipA
MFRRAVFNVYAHNRDDHGKQFGFLMDPQGLWRLAPAYDLTFSAGSGGEHATTVDGEGRSPDTARLLALARRIDLKPADADAIMDRVRGVIARWRSYADTTGVGRNSRDRIARTIAPRRRPS